MEKVIELNEIEEKYFLLLQGQITLQEFESWIYAATHLEDDLSEKEYLELISLNYKFPSAKYELGKLLKDRVDFGKFETIKMIDLLNSIIERDGQEAEALIQMYNLYCKGYYFLDELGLGIGLYLEVPSDLGVDYYHELSETEKKERVNKVYPHAQELSRELKSFLLSEEIELTGKQDENLNHWQYIDVRDKRKVSNSGHKSIQNKNKEVLKNVIQWVKKKINI